MGKATIIKVDGSKQELDHRPTLEEAQGIVGGYVEFIKARACKTAGGGYQPVVTLVVDGEGKIKNRPTNKVITNCYGPSIYNGYIVGDVIVLEGWQTVGG